ncbi:MAG: hypothetical protein KDB21_06045 [Acidimicrobiales bacterium]|nr:hypothetical protein [Acidimicrobiales bacterium]
MASRTYRFTMTIEVEPDHVAYDDPEWAADAAAFALSDGYGLNASYAQIEPLGTSGTAGERTYRFLITFEADDEHAAFDDPEWAADAAHGALTNEFGLAATYTEVGLVTGS